MGGRELPPERQRSLLPAAWQNRACPLTSPLLPSHLPLCPQTDLTHINILAELHCDAGAWEAALAVVTRAEEELLGEDEELPIDLRVSCWHCCCCRCCWRKHQGCRGRHVSVHPCPAPPSPPAPQVKAGAASAHLGDVAAAVDAFAPILQEPVDSFADLYLEAGAVLMGVGQPDKALPFFRCLAVWLSSVVWGALGSRLQGGRVPLALPPRPPPTLFSCPAVRDPSLVAARWRSTPRAARPRCGAGWRRATARCTTPTLRCTCTRQEEEGHTPFEGCWLSAAAADPQPLPAPPPPSPCSCVSPQTVVQQLGPEHPGHIEAVVALADLHKELGQQADAER